jgi:hypothetical protein
MKQAIFHNKRSHYRDKRTLGELINPDGQHFCYTLEDTVRGYGIKDYGNTAIPATVDDFTYYLRVMDSPKYGRVATIYSNLEEGEPFVNYGGIRFSHIRCHGGNSEEDTFGCLLVAKNIDIENVRIQGSMKAELTEEVQRLTNEGYDCRLRITNLPQLK